MHLFLLFSIPFILIWYILTATEYKWTSFIPPVLTGMLIATAACFIKEFFIFYSHTATASFASQFIYLSARDSLIPVTLLCAVFFFLSKDDWDYKAKSIAPLTLSFFAIYIPYFVITGKEPQSAYLNIIKPVLFTSLSLTESILFSSTISSVKKKNSLSAVFIFSIAASLFIPSLAESVWYYSMNTVIWILISILYISVPVLVTVMARIHREPQAVKSINDI